MKGQYRLQPAAERVALHQHGVHAALRGMLGFVRPSSMQGAAVHLQRVDVLRAHQQHEQREIATKIEHAGDVGASTPGVAPRQFLAMYRRARAAFGQAGQAVALIG